MTTFTSVRSVIDGNATRHHPVGPLAVHFCARLSGVSLERYTTDPRVLADCVLNYYERFRPDAVWVSADTWVTAEAMGAAVGFPGADQPLGSVDDPRIRSAADVDRIPPPDPSSQGRFPLMIEAVQRVREVLGPDVFIVACFDQYPFSLACAMMGMDVTMIKLIDDRAMVRAVMERGLEYAFAYARALADAGADMLSGGDSPAGLIGPQSYRDLALPFERRLVAGLKSTHNLPVSLHICGNAMPILGSMATSGADVLELDHWVNIRDACATVGPEITIWGNLDPVGVLAQGTPDDVRQATQELLRTINECGHDRFVLSSGCTLPVETPSENILAMMATARETPAAQPFKRTVGGGL